MRGFENKEQEQELWATLHRHLLPVKFAYVGEAAHHHNMLARQSIHREIALAVNIEMAALKNYFTHNKYIPQQICDIGPGNGKHSITFLEAFSNEGYKINKYLGLDFSRTLLDIGTEQIKGHSPHLQIESSTWDIEKAPTNIISRWRAPGATLVTLTGHTLGNPENPRQILEFLHDSCIRNDILVLGVALIHDGTPESFIKPYNTATFKAAALKPLRMAGINTREGDFKLEFSLSEKAVIAEFIFHNDITIEYTGEQFSFHNGDSIRCFTSRRFTDREIKTLLNESKWNLQSEAYNTEKTLAVYVATSD